MNLRATPVPDSPTLEVPVHRGEGALTPEAFEALYREHWPAVVDYLRFRVGPTDAADVAAAIAGTRPPRPRSS